MAGLVLGSPFLLYVIGMASACSVFIGVRRLRTRDLQAPADKAGIVDGLLLGQVFVVALLLLATPVLMSLYLITGVVGGIGACWLVPMLVPRLHGSRRCPRCLYDMRGIPSRRCPECGHGVRYEGALLTDRILTRAGVVAVIMLIVSVLGSGVLDLSRTGSLGRFLPRPALLLIAGDEDRWAGIDRELKERLQRLDEPVALSELEGRIAVARLAHFDGELTNRLLDSLAVSEQDWTDELPVDLQGTYLLRRLVLTLRQLDDFTVVGNDLAQPGKNNMTLRVLRLGFEPATRVEYRPRLAPEPQLTLTRVNGTTRKTGTIAADVPDLSTLFRALPSSEFRLIDHFPKGTLNQATCHRIVIREPDGIFESGPHARLRKRLVIWIEAETGLPRRLVWYGTGGVAQRVMDVRVKVRASEQWQVTSSRTGASATNPVREPRQRDPRDRRGGEHDAHAAPEQVPFAP